MQLLEGACRHTRGHVGPQPPPPQTQINLHLRGHLSVQDDVLFLANTASVGGPSDIGSGTSNPKPCTGAETTFSCRWANSPSNVVGLRHLFDSDSVNLRLGQINLHIRGYLTVHDDVLFLANTAGIIITFPDVQPAPARNLTPQTLIPKS